MECNKFIGEYIKYISKGLKEIEKNNSCLIELPFPRPSGDSVFIKISKNNNNTYVLSDQGFMDEYLFHYGMNLWDLSKSADEIFTQLRRRYKIPLNNKSPEILLFSSKSDINKKIFQMSNIISELASLRFLAQPVQFDLFKAKVKFFCQNNKLNFKEEPNISFQIDSENYQFQFDFLFYKNNVFVKLLKKRRIRHWALNFRVIKEYQGNNGAPKLVAFYSDKEDVDKNLIKKWFGTHIDGIFNFNKEKIQILNFLEKTE